MGRSSKATTARRNNLGKTETHQKPIVEDASVSDNEDMDFEDSEDNLLEEGFYLPDEGDVVAEDSDDSDSDDDELSKGELDELQIEEEIEHFNAVLFEAQAMAVKAKREAAGQKTKRKRHYPGNSVRTKQHYAQKRRALAATGQKLISSLFSKKEKESNLCVRGEMEGPEIIEITDNSDSSDEQDNNIEMSLIRLFPEVS